MNYKSIALALLFSMPLSLYGMRGRKLSNDKVESNSFLQVERSKSRYRSISRERELSMERDRERAKTASKCIDFSKTIVTAVMTVVKLILSIAR